MIFFFCNSFKANSKLIILFKFKTQKGILYNLANCRPFAFLLLLIIYFILIGKLYSLEFLINAFKLVPAPEIKTQAFFFTF